MDRLNFKDPAVQRRFVEKTLDEVIEAAARAGFQCHVVYNDCPVVEPRSPREVVVHANDTTGKVTKIN